jgi:hypothetical protein
MHPECLIPIFLCYPENTVILSFHLVADERDYTHLRDHVWGDLRMKTLEKRDNLKKTGRGGGVRFSPLEEAVLDAIGDDSAIVQGLAVTEQWDSDSEVAIAQR